MLNLKTRSRDWNYGGSKWKLSRSKIDSFLNCPKCFYIDNKLGITKPKLPSFNLNTAVDTLFKKEFDLLRKKGQAHELMKKYGIDAVPYTHKELDDWRENFVGAQFVHEPTGMIISGAIDDLWVNQKGELYIVDYKSTSKDGDVSLDDEWKEGYKRQIEIYQWLFRKKGFDVAETGYFVYANARTSNEKFDAKLDFDITILSHVGTTDWVEETIFAIKDTLESSKMPEPDDGCEYCKYVELRKNL